MQVFKYLLIMKSKEQQHLTKEIVLPTKIQGTSSQSRINVGPTFINFRFFQGPTASFCFYINSEKKFMGYKVFQAEQRGAQVYSFCQIFQALRLFKAQIFILFAKVSRSCDYSLPYVYSGLQSKGKTLLGIVNKLQKTKSLLTSPSNVLPYHLK